MTEHRIHYSVNGKPRCGNKNRYSWTHDPEKVTCKACNRLMKGEVK